MNYGTFKICPPFKKTLGFRIKTLAIKFSVARFIALWLAPHIETGRRRYMRSRIVRLNDSVGLHEVTFKQKVSAAVFIATHGADGSGVSTWATLMHPMREFNLDDVDMEASRLISGVLTAWLEAQPHQQIDRLLQDQAERLSSDYVF